jgi:hypothetical protein
MAKVELHINGYFEITFLNPVTKQPVDDDYQLGIMDNLQQGEYVLGMDSKTVKDINDLDNVLYTFVLDPTVNVSYEFDEL